MNMYKKISAFLILIFALNVYFTSFNFHAFADGKKVKIEEKKEKQKSAFLRVLETIAIPFAYALHWFQVKLYGPINVGVDYHIKAWLFYEPEDKKLREIWLKEEVKREPLTAKEREIYSSYIHSDEYEKITNVPITIYLPVVLYNRKLQKISVDRFIHKNVYGKPTTTARIVKTKYGDMIEVADKRDYNSGFGYLDLTAGAFSYVTRHIFPYHLTSELSLVNEEELSDESEKAGKGYFERHQKIATYIYVYWEGKAKLELDFWIGAGARFGQAGSNGLGYGFSKEQPDKTVEVKSKGPDHFFRKLIFKKPGWYKVYMDKISDISVL